jgi:hypothetical protein
MGCELEENIKTQVEGILASVNHWTQGLCKELDAKMKETLRELQILLNTQTRNLHEERELTQRRTSKKRSLRDRNHTVQVRNTAKRN